MNLCSQCVKFWSISQREVPSDTRPIILYLHWYYHALRAGSSLRGESMKAYVRPIMGRWVFTIESTDQVVYSKLCNRLIEAIDTACNLQLHIDNVNELPLNQYQGGLSCTTIHSNK